MIVVNDLTHGEAVGEACGYVFNRACDVVISRVTPEGKLLGGVIVCNYSPNASASLHMAGFVKNWATPELVHKVFWYCFVQLNLRKLFATVASDNLKALEIDKRLGFKEEVTIADVFQDADLIVLSMRRDQCRWLRRRRSKEVTDGLQGGRASAA